MSAALLRAPGCLELTRVERPVPGPGELVLRVEAALTCGTDVKTFRRGHPKLPLPAPLGHEYSGTVSAAGPGVERFREGDAVAVVPTAPCGGCRLCTRGRENLCAGAVGRIALGGFAEYVRVPAHIAAMHTFERPAHVSAESAAALEPLACVVHGAARLDLARAETVLLLGDGPIALLFVQLARLRGAGRIMLAGRRDVRLQTAAALGAERVTRARGEALRDEVLTWTGTGGADVVVECVGTEETWELASRCAAPAGTVLLFGGCAAGSRVRLDPHRIHYEEVDHIGAFHYAPRDVRLAWTLIREGEVDVESLITHRRPLSAMADALQLAQSGDVIKVSIRP